MINIKTKSLIILLFMGISVQNQPVYGSNGGNKNLNEGMKKEKSEQSSDQPNHTTAESISFQKGAEKPSEDTSVIEDKNLQKNQNEQEERKFKAFSQNYITRISFKRSYNLLKNN